VWETVTGYALVGPAIIGAIARPARSNVRRHLRPELCGHKSVARPIDRKSLAFFSFRVAVYFTSCFEYAIALGRVSHGLFLLCQMSIHFFAVLFSWGMLVSLLLVVVPIFMVSRTFGRYLQDRTLSLNISDVLQAIGLGVTVVSILVLQNQVTNAGGETRGFARPWPCNARKLGK
jgi:hypothetical protein